MSSPYLRGMAIPQSTDPALRSAFLQSSGIQEGLQAFQTAQAGGKPEDDTLDLRGFRDDLGIHVVQSTLVVARSLEGSLVTDGLTTGDRKGAEAVYAALNSCRNNEGWHMDAKIKAVMERVQLSSRQPEALYLRSVLRTLAYHDTTPRLIATDALAAFCLFRTNSETAQ